MNATAGTEADLADERRALQRRGLLERAGPAECTEAMSIALVFRGVSRLTALERRNLRTIAK
ncbi:malate/lactate dehydrogenase [Arthrobacter sp. OAP107]